MTDQRPAAYLAAELEERLATDRRVAELGLTVTVAGDVITVRGRLGGADCRAQVAEVLEEAAPGYEIVNEVECVDLTEPTGDQIEAVQ